MAIQIREHLPGKDLDSFMSVPELLYAGDPGFVMPLNMEQRDRLTPRKNPFFEHGEVALFTARRDGKLAGRISAQIDRAHLARHADGCGLFGYFDTVNDARVGRALVNAAASWLRARGMTTMRGPFSLSINDEVGLMVAGQAEPPMLRSPYHRAYQQEVAAAAGLSRCKELYAWRYSIGEIPQRALKAHQQIKAMPEVRMRPIDKRNLERDVRIVVDIYNDAWSYNFHFVPMSDNELAKMASDMRLVLDDRIAFIAEIDGEPAAMCIALPNLNEAIHDLRGRLSPAGLVKLLWRLKVNSPKSALLVLLGIKSKFRNKKRYGGLSTALYAEVATQGAKVGYEWAELGWTWEDNHAINLGIKMMGGKVYKRFYIYELGLK